MDPHTRIFIPLKQNNVILSHCYVYFYSHKDDDRMMSAEVKIPSRQIRVNSSTLLSRNSNPSIHLLPCRVECDGVRDEGGEGCTPAKVDAYFAPVIRESNERIQISTIDKELSPVYSATFRGRRLKGIKVSIPNGFVGCVLKECNPSNDDQVYSGRNSMLRFHRSISVQHCETRIQFVLC